jgi:hypothetical protein
LFTYNGEFTANEVNVCSLSPSEYISLPFKVILKRENAITIYAGLLGLFVILISGPIIPYINSINGFYNFGLSIMWTVIIFLMILIICVNYSYNSGKCNSEGKALLNLWPMFFSLYSLAAVAVISTFLTKTGKNSF